LENDDAIPVTNVDFHELSPLVVRFTSPRIGLVCSRAIHGTLYCAMIARLPIRGGHHAWGFRGLLAIGVERYPVNVRKRAGLLSSVTSLDLGVRGCVKHDCDEQKVRELANH
jgi:hypothetical protein